MKIHKKILLMTMLLITSTLLISCHWGIEAETAYDSPSLYESNRMDMIEDVTSSVVIVESNNGYGSGILFNKITLTSNNYKYAVLTAYENIDFDAVTQMTVQLESNELFQVTSAIGDQDYEIAIVYFETSDDLDVYEIDQLDGVSQITLSQGMDVYAIGTPYDKNFFNYVSEGVLGIQSYDYNGIEDLTFVHSAESNPGMEGAPVFDINGDLLGIYIDKLYYSDSTDTVPIEGMNFALNMNVIASVIIHLDETLALSSVSSTMNVSQLVDDTYETIVTDMVDRVLPSIVSVIGTGGLGSGIIFKEELLENNVTRYYVLTNYHVVSESTEIRIKFSDQTYELPVTDYQGSESYDIAVLRFETEDDLAVYDIPPISDQQYVDIVQGQDVFAIGSPYSTDFYNYTTEGIVSLTNLTYKGIYQLGIVHDAEINPGNSGGPLFNLNGEVIGVNVAKIVNIYEDDETIPVEGLNYSLNINVIAQVINGYQEEDYELVERDPKLGITVVEYDSEFEIFPIKYSSGVLVVGFDYTRNSYESLALNDLIVKIDDVDVYGTDELATVLETKDFGDVVRLTILRINANDEVVTLEIDITLS